MLLTTANQAHLDSVPALRAPAYQDQVPGRLSCVAPRLSPLLPACRVRYISKPVRQLLLPDIAPTRRAPSKFDTQTSRVASAWKYIRPPPSRTPRPTGLQH